MEASGHQDALSYLFSIFERGYTEQTVRELHRLFYFRIDSPKAGEYRQENVIITGTDYMPPPFEKIPELMARFNSKRKETAHPIKLAASAHEELANIHPFVDGNGRTARLLMNLILLREGFPIVSIPPLYRGRYLDAAKAGNKEDSGPFLEFLVQVTEQGLLDYLLMLDNLSLVK